MLDSYCNESIYIDLLVGINQQEGSYCAESGSVSRNLFFSNFYPDFTPNLYSHMKAYISQGVGEYSALEKASNMQQNSQLISV